MITVFFDIVNFTSISQKIEIHNFVVFENIYEIQNNFVPKNFDYITLAFYNLIHTKCKSYVLMLWRRA